MAVPYAFQSSAEMRAAAAGPAGQEICQEITAKTGLVPLAWFERGPRHLTSNRPVKSPADLKGLKMRIPGLGGEGLRRAGGTPGTLPGVMCRKGDGGNFLHFCYFLHFLCKK